MHTTVYSGAIVGIEGLVVEVEVDIARGIPAFSVVGLPNAAVREARERVTSAIKNSGCHFPLERITCNLAPADVKKEGSAHDLAIAIGILLASGQAEATTARTIFIGELAPSPPPLGWTAFRRGEESPRAAADHSGSRR